MTGLTRQQAAEALGALFGTQFRYLGGTYKAYSVEDRQGRTWKAMRPFMYSMRIPKG